MRIIIVGAGGHGQVVADILLKGLSGDGMAARPVGFVDDNPELQGRSFLRLPVLGIVVGISTIPHEAVVVGIGGNRIRRNICEQLAAEDETLYSAVHPAAIIGGDVLITEGCTVNAGVVINPGARIGRGVILNTACSVDHHSVIGDYAHIAPGVHLGGEVEVGEGALVGIGATVLPQRRVGAWSVVGAGAVVTEDVPPYSTVVGVPAQVIRDSKAEAIMRQVI